MRNAGRINLRPSPAQSFLCSALNLARKSLRCCRVSASRNSSTALRSPFFRPALIGLPPPLILKFAHERVYSPVSTAQPIGGVQHVLERSQFLEYLRRALENSELPWGHQVPRLGAAQQAASYDDFPDQGRGRVGRQRLQGGVGGLATASPHLYAITCNMHLAASLLSMSCY